MLNFSWLLWIFVVAAGAAVLWRGLQKGRNNSMSSRPRRVLCEKCPDTVLAVLTLVSSLYILTRFGAWSNPRYLLLCLPLLVLLFGKSLRYLVSRARIRAAVLAVLPCLVGVSSFRTIDPLSRFAFGVFHFGDHDLHATGALRGRHDLWVKQGNRWGVRDQIVYNSEFTNLHYLAQEGLQRSASMPTS